MARSTHLERRENAIGCMGYVLSSDGKRSLSPLPIFARETAAIAGVEQNACKKAD
jgi:hypothetical protein